MRRFCIARPLVLGMLVTSGILGTASAQAPGQVEPASATFLEKRVPEELATEGVVLSRRNLALQVEQLGDRWLVSLVDLTTGRVAASTKVDALPADREAAVASLTHVVSDLAAQIVGRVEPPPPPPPPAPVVAPPAPPAQLLLDDRAAREQREIAELKFRRGSLRFGSNLQLTATGNAVVLHRSWVVYQGDLDEEIEPTAFYTTVGRPDLSEAYTQRRGVKIASLVISGVAAAVGFGILFYDLGSRKDCPTTLPFDQFEACLDDNRPGFVGPLVAIGVSSVALGVGFWYHFHPHPIEENDAKALADAYNQRLRRQLGLPVVTRAPLLHDVKLTPFIARGDTGLALGARF